MSVEIVEGEYHKVMICNTSDTAFGPTFSEDEDVEAFLKWLLVDPRILEESDLESKVNEWRLLPECGYCEKHTSDTLRSLVIGKNKYDCCDECYELFYEDLDNE